MDEAICFNLTIFYAVFALCIIGFAIAVWEVINEEKQSKKRANLNRLEYGLNHVCVHNKPIDFKVGPDERDDCRDLLSDDSRPIASSTVVDRKRSRVYWSDGFGNTFIIR